jgi:hypothetical protein
MQLIPAIAGRNKADPSDPHMVRVTDGRIIHSFEFDNGEDFPWLRPLLWAFEGWRLIRDGDVLLIVPDDEKPWGIA